MLGLDVLRAGERAGHELIGVDLPELDITDPDAVGQTRRRCSTVLPGRTSTAPRRMCGRRMR
jgi:hypothetical protein